MGPSPRSRPNHPRQPDASPWTRDAGHTGRRPCGRLRHSSAGSPLSQAESDSLSFGTAGPHPAAPHPASRRRSCFLLLSRSSSRDDSDSHRLIPCMCVRTKVSRWETKTLPKLPGTSCRAFMSRPVGTKKSVVAGSGDVPSYDGPHSYDGMEVFRLLPFCGEEVEGHALSGRLCPGWWTQGCAFA
jgi:hypothetical protein